MPTETLLIRTLVELADTLVDDFDVVELLTLLSVRCVELLDVSAAGLMLVAPEGDLRVAASSSEALRVVELFELQAQEGPCSDCFSTGEPVLSQDLTGPDEGRWPSFGPVAVAAGFRSVHAVPMRLRGNVIGALNLFQTHPGELSADDVGASRAFADMATIGILQHRAVNEARVLAEQLSFALNSRVVIEQAKGALGERLGLNMEDAFSRLRTYARNHNLRLIHVARGVLEGTVASADLGPAETTSRS